MFVCDITAGDLERHKLNACTYCGITTDITRDHVIPVSWRGFGRDYAAGDTIPACVECNCTLSDVPIFNVQDRSAYLVGRYKTKYKKLIMNPVWSEREISAMSCDFQSQIRSMMQEQQIINDRMINLIFVADGNYEKIEVTSYGKDFVTAYKFFTVLIGTEGGKKHRIAESAEAVGISFEQAKRIAKEIGDPNPVNQFKHDHKIPFETKIIDVRHD